MGVAKISEELLDEKFNDLRVQREALKKDKPLAVSVRLSVADIEYALRKHDGNLKEAARFLGVERPLLKRKIDQFPSLQRLVQSIQEEILDEAEAKLVEQVREGYFPAVSLLLRTKGKDRGYTERITSEFEMGENATRSAAALIDAMRRGATPALPEKPVITVEDYEIVEEAATS